MKNNQKSKTDYITRSLYRKINYMVERLKQPASWWKIGWVVLALISMYYNLNYRIVALEEFRGQVDIIEIKTTLTQIQSDLTWIKSTLSSNLK
jgi:hypothetical protein